MNPRRRRRASSQDDLSTWLLFGIGGWLLFRGLNTAAAAVSTGGQMILPQETGTVWYNDPYTGGDGAFFQGSLPPGSAPPWRLASNDELIRMGNDLAAGLLVAAGGGLIAPNPGFFT